jgi:hypothetical protein
MKTKFSFPKKPHTSLLLATATLLLLSMQCGTFADDASWISLGSTDWNTNGNWLTDPAGGGYPGTTAGNTATFRDLSTVTSLFVSATPANSIAAITFTNAETHSFTITVNPTRTLTISGTGITNNSVTTQNFVTTVDGSGNFGTINFTNSATAGSMTAFTNNGGTVFGAGGGNTQFFDTSTAGSGTFTNNGVTFSGAGGGVTAFFGTDATHFPTAGSATITNNGGAVSGGFGGETDFFTTSTAGSATITNTGSAFSGAGGGVTNFFDFSTAGSATITNNGGTGSGAAGGGVTQFFALGATLFSTAGSATITNNGGTASGAGAGQTRFLFTSTAGSATLIANGGVSGADGGSIRFFQDSTGGTASVDVRNNGTGTAGFLDISAHTGGVTIGSLEGSGNVFLGANNLTVGSNNLSKTFSGVIQDGGGNGGTGGSLTKTGTGAFTLTGANTYTGGTTVTAGSLFVNNTGGLSGTGTGAVTVNGGTLGGGNGTAIASTISGAVTVNSGATLAPGPTGDGSTGILRTGDLTLAPGSFFSVDLEGNVAGTDYDQVFVFGAVSILNANLALNLVSGLSVGDNLFIVESTGAVTGTFFNLPDGTTFTQDGVTFTIDYYPSGALGGNVELTVDSVTAVPEPSTWVASVLAFVALAYWQRRRFARMLRRA